MREQFEKRAVAYFLHCERVRTSIAHLTALPHETAVDQKLEENFKFLPTKYVNTLFQEGGDVGSPLLQCIYPVVNS